MGDEVLFDGSSVQGKICLAALQSMIAKVYAMRYGAHFPWLQEGMVETLTCPLAHFRQDWADYENPVVFELRRRQK